MEYRPKPQEFKNKAILVMILNLIYLVVIEKSACGAKTVLELKNLRAVRFGGGHVMAWECMAATGTGSLAIVDGIINARKHIEMFTKM